MRRTIIKYTGALVLILILSACDDFLNIQPESETGREELFKTQRGFENALNGLYVQLASNTLFGSDLTYNLIEKLARNVALRESDAIFNYNYEDSYTKANINGIWLKLYFVIANANSILDEIDNKKDIFSKGYYNMIKGEALAIRAYCHYTLVKLFADDYNKDPNAKGIPYYTSYVQKQKSPFINIAAVYDHIIKDFKAAELLLKEDDPSLEGFDDYVYSDGKTMANIEHGKDLKNNRRLYFNYWTVIGNLARVYLSMSDYDNAFNYAKKIKEAEVLLFPWVYYPPADKLYYTECLMLLNVDQLENNYQSFFVPLSLITTLSSEVVSSQVFETDKTGYEFDYRIQPYMFYQWNSPSEGIINYYTLKYDQTIDYGSQSGGSSSYYSKTYVVPILKKGEIYLILAESAIKGKGDKNLAIDLLNKLRNEGRGILQQDAQLQYSMTEGEVLDFILKEYRRETYMEGQLFYQYKRLNKETIPDLTFGTYNMSTRFYTLPVPDDEELLNP